MTIEDPYMSIND